MAEPYEIGIVAYGSLVWDQRDLRTRGPWNKDGPVLPIEFCRVSRNGRLTLAVHHEHGVPVTCHWALSACTGLHRALHELHIREGMVDGADAGFVDLRRGSRSHEESYVGSIETWAREKGLDAVVWSALPSNFDRDGRGPYSVAAASAYLGSLDGRAQRAREYIINAPAEVDTPLRRAVTNSGWLRR